MLRTTMNGIGAAGAACFLFLSTAQPAFASPSPGTGSYEALTALFEDFIDWKDPEPIDGAVDYSPETVERRRDALRAYQAQLANIGVADWDRHQQVDYLAARAQFDQHDFLLNVTRPWARDPGYYIDPLQRLAYTELPAEGEALETLRARLQSVPDYLAQARINLIAPAADYADLAIHSLSNPDGVGHGHPYRPVQPAGLIGWFEDIRARAAQDQPELIDDIERAQQAIADFQDWMIENRPAMTADAGIGREAYDWYLRHVKLMPYDTDEVIDLAQRELERTWAFYVLERHRNRDLPELELPESEEEYHAQLAGSDALIRDWLVREEFITIPEYVPQDWREMGFNAPWIVRPNGPMFWEQIMYRDVSPDHLHATIPGHRFDGHLARRVDHPIRGRIHDSGRTEGWGLYVEEAPLQLGLFDERPRTREFIYVFGIFRAVRTIGDVHMQRNEMTVEETMDYWKEWTPYLDDDVARVDAAIYLRRPPGYGISYTIGMFQLQKLLMDRARQLGEDFVLQDFHDYLMQAGRLPVSLLRYDLTGHDDEIAALWDHTPLSELDL